MDAPEGPEGDDGSVQIAALELRLPGSSVLVVEAVDGESWRIVQVFDDGTSEERPHRHDDFVDAVEYVAAVADRNDRSLPVVDPRDGLEALAVFDGIGGMLIVVKEAVDRYVVSWVDDDGDVEEVSVHETAKAAILEPVLDDELFTDVDG